MVKTSPSNARDADSIRSHMPRGQKTQNRSNFETNSIKTLKMAHIKKIFLKKDREKKKETEMIRGEIRLCYSFPISFFF